MPTEIYYGSFTDFQSSEQQLNYVALNKKNLLNNTATCRQTLIFNDLGINSGVADFNLFYHYYNDTNTQFTRAGIVTITTSNGVLNFNYADSNTDFYTSGSVVIINTISFKSGIYATYNNITVQFEILTDGKTMKFTIKYN
jgi:hypothetical protein